MTQKRLNTVFVYALIVLVTFVVAQPFLWVVSLAFKSPAEAFGYPPRLIPEAPTWENFRVVLFETPIILRSFWNSTVITVITTLTNIVFAVMAGYAFAKLKFPGREPLFYLLISTMMVPAAVTLIPLFLMVRQFPLAGGNDLLGQGGSGLLNTLVGAMIPNFVGALNIFLARQYFRQLPDELAEAARIDGATEAGILWWVYFPIALPMVATIGILSFVGIWEDYLWPLVVLTSTENFTIQLVLSSFIVGGNIQWGLLMAATILASLPVILMFIFFQRYFIQGLSAGAVKG